MNYELEYWLLVVTAAGAFLWAAHSRWTIGSYRYYIKVLDRALEIEKSQVAWIEDHAHKYEELRELIDDGSSVMTHEDAMEEVKRLQKRDGVPEHMKEEDKG